MTNTTTLYREEITDQRQAELTAAIESLVTSAPFLESSYEEQMLALADHLATTFGYELNQVVEVKLDKPWGGYLTLNSTEKGAEKVLIVRPVPGSIPKSWDWDGPYAKVMGELTSQKGVALSFQRHTDGRTEVWRPLAGSGFHLTSADSNNPPSLENISCRAISSPSHKYGYHRAEHQGSRWHAALNTSPNEYLLLHEIITLQEAEGSFDETNIERAYDLYSRAGISRNI